MSTDDRQNIILISMDATRWDHLTCYGYYRETTPNIDELAAQGVLYEQATSPGCWTLTSHASLFTGLYVSQYETHFSNPVLDDNVCTIVELLRRHKYQTVGFHSSAWLFNAFGFNRGFES